MWLSMSARPRAGVRLETTVTQCSSLVVTVCLSPICPSLECREAVLQNPLAVRPDVGLTSDLS